METELEGFDEFWTIYPRRVAKLAAKRMFARALKVASAGQILAGARRYANERRGQDAKYTKHPATWLNGGCWDDEPGMNNGRSSSSLLAAIERIGESGSDQEAGARALLGLPAR